ncbi:hypothetical protein JCGZ_12215 [Jatropha curcas]|uniref:Uncharacterized protein n=1 Tax=Jatropha curcas TaxID=180498 RepID=A0A067KEC7_JATCU|nr:hypothetical protein JCGZ_12215 [Jatropha curcas]
MQVVEDLTDRLDDESRSYVEIRASDDEEEEDQIIMGTSEDEYEEEEEDEEEEEYRWLEAEHLIQTRPAVVRVEVVAQDAVPVDEAARQILRIIKLQLHKEGYTWDAVPQEARDFYWEEFQKHFIWDEAIMAMLKVAWEKLCADRYADFTYRMRRSELGPEPTPIEVFTYTHTKDYDLNMFIDRRAENYTTARERIVTSQTDESEAESRIDKLSLYLEAVGGEKKRKVYGIGSQASQFCCGSTAHASTASSGPQPERSAEEFTELWARVDDQQRQCLWKQAKKEDRIKQLQKKKERKSYSPVYGSIKTNNEMGYKPSLLLELKKINRENWKRGFGHFKKKEEEAQSI